MEQLLILGIGGMLLFALGVIVFVLIHQRKVIRYQLSLQALREQQQRLMLEAAIESEEKERKRIAGDLHDEVGASLATVRLYLLQTVKEQVSPRALETSNAAREVLDETIETIRQLSHQLSPEMLVNFGLGEALQNFSRKIDSAGGPGMSFQAPEGLPRLSPERELAIYRIVQEHTSNVLKHAQAQHIRIQLSRRGQHLICSMENDGRPLTHERFEALKHTPGGLGLKNIQNRVNILQANINFEKRKSGAPGTVMTLTVPVAAAEDIPEPHE